MSRRTDRLNGRSSGYQPSRNLPAGQRRVTRAEDGPNGEPGAVLVEIGKTNAHGLVYTERVVLTPEDQLWLADVIINQRLLQLRYLQLRQASLGSKSREEDEWDEAAAARAERRQRRREERAVLAGASATSPTGATR